VLKICLPFGGDDAWRLCPEENAAEESVHGNGIVKIVLRLAKVDVAHASEVVGFIFIYITIVPVVIFI
jgi:hypothetical protein